MLILAAVLACDRPAEPNVDIKAFEDLARKWKSHCDSVLVSSFMEDRLETPHFEALANLGREYLPLIIERYRQDQLPWNFVLERITRAYPPVNPGSFSPAKERQKWLEWWSRERTAVSE